MLRQSLKDELIAATNTYINNNSNYLSFLNCMGDAGKERAEAYLEYLQTTDDNDIELLDKVINDVGKNLGSSKNFRLELAKVLAEHSGIPQEKIERQASSIFASCISTNGVILKSLNQATCEAIIGLIKDKNKQNVAGNSSTSSLRHSR